VPTDQGSFAFTEAALNFAVQPLPKLRIAAQLFARDLGSQGNNRVVLDWGLGEYRAWDALGFRAGRIKFPVGLYNTLADADVTRPEIFQPSGLYPPERRDLTSAIDGIGVFGTIPLHAAGYLEYEALLGTIDLDESYVLGRVARDTSAALVPALATQLSGVDYVVSEKSGSAKSSWGGYVEWHPPVAGLRLRAGLQGADVDLASVATYTGFAGTAPVSLAVRSSIHSRVPHQVVLSGEYARGGLRLSAEHSRSRSENSTTLSGLPFPLPPAVAAVQEPTSTYGQVAYRFDERFQASAYYSVSYPDRNDKDGRALAARGQAAHGARLKDLSFTLRLDVNSHWLLKAEVHRMDGTANLSAAENPESLEEDWTLLALKTTVYF
jgi:hypothetical protein